MNDAHRRALLAELKMILFSELDKGKLPAEIRLFPRMRDLMTELHCVESAVAKAECEYLQRLIQIEKNFEDGGREWIYDSGKRLPLFEGDEVEQTEEIQPRYLRLEKLKDDPRARQAKLSHDQAYLTGYIANMGHMDRDDRDELRDTVSTSLRRSIEKVGQLPMVFEESVFLDDVTKTTLDKLGDEAGSQPWSTAEGDKHEDVG